MGKFLEFFAACFLIHLPLTGADLELRQKINLNTATRTELMQLPRIGPKMADRIVRHRRQLGHFKRLEELRQVKGIGEITLQGIRPYLRIDIKEPQARKQGQGGFTLLEGLWVFGLVGVLSLMGLAFARPQHVGLQAVCVDLKGALDHAKHLARAKGESVILTLGDKEGLPKVSQDVLLLSLPRGVKWGKPSHIPLPAGMDDVQVADAKGASHTSITMSPRCTCTAAVWFFHNDSGALCVRLNGQGRLQSLRYNPRQRAWFKEL